MPYDFSKFTDKEVINIILYGHPTKDGKSIYLGPFGLFPCNLCRWKVLEHEPTDLGVIFQLYCHGIGSLCQWCEISLFWEIKKRNIVLDIGRVVFS